MPERILVTGGTGQLGSVVVDQLVAAGERVRALSRKRRSGRGAQWAVGDLRTGRGINTALAGCDVVLHCAADYRREADAIRTLVEAARWTGNPPHLVYVSIVGVDRVPLGYYRAKLAAEDLIVNSGLPHTIQRATQFHSLVRAVFAAAGRLPVVPVPRWRFQPVDVRDLAGRLAELAKAEPVGRAPDFGGPEVLPAADLAKAVLAAAGRRKRVLPVSLPGSLYRAYADGGNLAPEHADGVLTFARYLAERPDPGALRYH
ncbi:SDR family oxidoreductase [Amycolatopsis sp. FDAARGOS 1241]|uniref:SDR family oxidoreductase n=1 Tax=Amycolatopsis sp. FDAARGOS 1241 TaxID=2778070 RepID=UPI00194F015D|nr:NAD(P)H-binding protein [Amycolatopsis sp. FDAARGOS 1241]QRP49881.1 NAD(P)H-binding protein [Amycolatopsis sp. FDAARGOS 1241]